MISEEAPNIKCCCLKFLMIRDHIFAFTFWNALLVFLPTTITTAMITAAIAATIMPYSTAVAPSSSLRNAISFFILFPLLSCVSIPPGKTLWRISSTSADSLSQCITHANKMPYCPIGVLLREVALHELLLLRGCVRKKQFRDSFRLRRTHKYREK